jgi:hypothetical protein
MDGEFEKVRDELLDKITVNICSKNEHVPEIERKIRHIKERCRCIKADQPVTLLPNVMVKHLVLHAVMFINAYADPQGISTDLSPREIILRWNLSTDRHCRAQFGSYCVAFDEPDSTVTNTMQERAIQAICLGPTGNFQGTHKFLDLSSGQVVKRKRFDELPMPDSVIRKLERWGRRDKQNGRLTFADRNNNAFDWDDEYELKPLIDDNAIEPEHPAPFPDIPAEMPGVDLETNIPAVTEKQGTDAEERHQNETRARALENANLGPRDLAVLDDL